MDFVGPGYSSWVGADGVLRCSRSPAEELSESPLNVLLSYEVPACYYQSCVGSVTLTTTEEEWLQLSGGVTPCPESRRPQSGRAVSGP